MKITEAEARKILASLEEICSKHPGVWFDTVFERKPRLDMIRLDIKIKITATENRAAA